MRFWRSFSRNKTAMLGLVIVILMASGALLADVVAPFDPIEPHYTDRLMPPGGPYLLGTDELGRDIFSRLLYGARISLVIGLVAQGVSVTIGIVLGLLAGWYGGWVDDVVSRLTEIVWAIPGLMFLIVVVTIFEPSPLTIFAALGLIAWPGQARLMRGQVLVIRDMEYVIAARALGASTARVLFQHILPNAIAPMIVVATLGVAGAILTESTLSFLGLGVKIPNPSWGTMIDIGRNYTTNAWWFAIFPGLAIMITVLGFNFIGDGLRDALDPTQYD
ncbi:MAG: peptide ABC transporter permease [Anaerolineaceae bacterium]|nr:peptide ABC transporter permease [Anaerolineaceae bacterium]